MATYLSCIIENAEAGKIDDDTAETLFNRYQDAYDHAQKGGAGPDDADRDAGRRTQFSAEKEDLEARRREVLNLRARKRLVASIERFKLERRGYALGPSGGGKGRPAIALMPPEAGPFSKGAAAAEALNLMMSGKPGLAGGPFPSVEGTHKAVLGMLHAHMVDAISKFETRTGLDAPHRAILKNVVRELFGETSHDESARQIARGFTQAAELSRKLFNEAGGAIGHRDDWGLPQSHNAALVREAGRDKWVEAIIPLLDRSKMIDDFTGAPFGDNSIRQVLGDVWSSIITHGLIDRSPDERLGSGITAKQRTDERFLVFAGADAWMRYADQFGRSDAFDAMMGHLDSMAHDIAEMQVLGPSPDAQFQYLKRLAQTEAADEVVAGWNGADKAAKKQLDRAQDMWDAFTGVGNVPGSERAARVMSNTRAFLRSDELGSAILTDMPSAPFFGAMARVFAGSPIAGDLGQFVKLLASPQMREEAATLGFMNEAATDGLISTARDQLRLQTVGTKAGQQVNALARKLPAATMRLQGLTALFEARKTSFRLTAARVLNNAKGETLASLAASADGDKRTLAANLRAAGFTEDDWARIASTPSWEPQPGVAFLRPTDIMRNEQAGKDLALRVSEMISNNEALAVPVSGNLRSRTMFLGGTRPGTYLGEAVRSFGMYKTFIFNGPALYSEQFAHQALAYAAEHGVDPNSDLGSTIFGAGRVGGLLALTIPLTIAGAVTLQLKQIINGKDPLYMGDPKFWMSALLQGGSLGLFGDFFYSSHSRFGHTLAFSGAGPVLDAANDIWDATGGEAADLVDRAITPAHAGKPDKEGARVVRLLRQDTPVLSSLLWAKTGYNRAALDQLQKVVDPDAAAAFQRAQQRAMRENGQGYFWAPGDAGPSRAPDLSTMVVDHRAQ